jgi:hypothetical protein
LKAGGLFILGEYIGPSRFQTSPLVNDIINRVLKILPGRYRRNLYREDGSTIDHRSNPPIWWFDQNDPSEAVRSAEIVPTLRQFFDIVEMRPYGGAILHFLLSGIAGNFDENDERDRALLNLLTLLEDVLEETGAIQSDFAVIVARPR